MNMKLKNSFLYFSLWLAILVWPLAVFYFWDFAFITIIFFCVAVVISVWQTEAFRYSAIVTAPLNILLLSLQVHGLFIFLINVLLVFAFSFGKKCLRTKNENI